MRKQMSTNELKLHITRLMRLTFIIKTTKLLIGIFLSGLIISLITGLHAVIGLLLGSVAMHLFEILRDGLMVFRPIKGVKIDGDKS